MYNPQFTITNPILRNISLIEAAKALIDTSPLLPSWERRFQDEAVVRTVHHGTHLEGNELNFSEAKRVIEGEKIVARERDIQEVINYRNVIEFIGKTEDTKLTEALIKKLHRLTTEKILPTNQVEEYRRTSVVIRNSTTGEISFRPPPAVEIPYLLRALLEWLTGTPELHHVLKAGTAHYEIARIHPFTDGNGRVARAVTMLILYKEGYDIRRFFSLEEYYDRNAETYYGALQSVSTPSTPAPYSSEASSSGSNLPARPARLAKRAGGEPRTPRDSPAANLTPWLEYFVEGLAIEFNRIKEKIARISQDLKFQHALGGQVYLTDRQLKIIEHIQEVGFLQNQMFSHLFPNLSDDTILRELNDLMKKNIIKKKGKTKAARYVLA